MRLAILGHPGDIGQRPISTLDGQVGPAGILKEDEAMLQIVTVPCHRPPDNTGQILNVRDLPLSFIGLSADDV